MNAFKTSRRRFLKVSGQAGLAGLALTVGGRRLLVTPSDAAPAASGPVREVRLETREQEWELAPGKVVKAMSYKGQIPGPEIRVRGGERVRVVLTNGLRERTTIHWHGVDVPNAMDGVPGITQKPVQPGETFVYDFEARPAGTRAGITRTLASTSSWTSAPTAPGLPAAELGIGELEMGPDFGRPATPVQRGPVATALLYGVLLLCPAKFVLLWILQRREARDMGSPAGAPVAGDA